MKEHRSIRILSFLVIAYMLFALLWWSVLLHKKNNQTYQYQVELYKLDSSKSEIDLLELEAKFRRQNTMILGESIVFGLMLVLGIYFLYRAYQRVILASQNQKNFLLSITHELKSPLASNKLALQTLSKRKLDNHQQDELIQMGLAENERLSTLVNNLLMSARLDQNYQFHFSNTEINSLIRESIKKIQNKYPERKINIISNGETNVEIEIDQAALDSVISNLLDNAIKYSPNQSAIRVSVKEWKTNIEIEVLDEGIGIDQSERKLIFEQFYRVGNEQTRTSKGTGLGLFICAQIIKAHQGQINVTNNEPQGSKFTILLPKKQTNA